MRHPLSLEAFTDWLATMPADGEYDYTACMTCAFSQYLTAIGLKPAGVGPGYWRQRGADSLRHRPLPDGVEEIVYTTPWTFGAALSRARELQRTAGHE